jgi:hypothetical protein
LRPFSIARHPTVAMIACSAQIRPDLAALGTELMIF